MAYNLSEYSVWLLAVEVLCLLAAFLLLFLHYLRYDTMRIYNWNGERYRFIGRGRICRKNGTYVVKIRERLADLSYTTRYRFCPNRRFVKRNRYRELLVQAGRNTVWLPIEEVMQYNIYFRGQ